MLQNSVKVDQKWLKFGQKWEKVGKHAAKMDEKRDKMGQKMSKDSLADQKWAMPKWIKDKAKRSQKQGKMTLRVTQQEATCFKMRRK